MKAKYILLPLLLGSLTAAQAKPTKTAAHFLENKGQVKDQHGQPRNDIQFSTTSPGLTLFIGNGQVHYQWSQQLGNLKAAMYRMDVTLVGANTHAIANSEQQQDYYERYYTLPQNGTTAHSYRKVTYANIYPNIDWVLHTNGSQIEYDFVVRPGGKVSDIRMQYGGTSKLSLSNGQLTATTPMGIITEAAPVSTDATGKTIATSFQLTGNTITFNVAPYSGTLTIDPTLSWSTYYGGTGDETIRSGCTTGNNSGNAYLGGSTTSPDHIATTGSYQDTVTTGSMDAFLVKFNSSGSRLWATYYGSDGDESVYGITCDPSGNIYLSGGTNSASGIASPGAYQTVLNNDDAFLVKFDATGARIWGTYYGGDGPDQGLAVSCDPSGNVYLGGYTNSDVDVASTGAFQTTRGGGQDAFLAKFNSGGSRLWGTYFGGPATEQGMGISCDAGGNVFLSGYTQSTSGVATSGAHQTTIGGSKDAFLAKFTSTGTETWATYMGGTGQENGFGVACDEAGNSYLSGSAASTTGISTTGSYQPTYGGGAIDGMLAKFNSAGVRQWSTYYGGPATDAAYAVSYRAGKLYVAGYSASTSGIALAGTFQDTMTGSGDAFLAKFDTSGTRNWATYFGGEDNDNGYGVFCNSTSQLFLGGQTSSLGLLTTTGACQTANGGSSDGFLAVFNDCILTAPASMTGSDTVCRSAAYTYSVPTVAGAASYTWTLPAGWSGTSTTNSITVTSGNNSDTIKVVANFPCGASTILKKAVYVRPLPVLTPAGTINICSGDSVTLTSSAGSAYQWLINGSVIAGANTALYTVHGSGHYAVIATNLGCTDTSHADTVIVHALPVPAIAATGGVLSTGTYVSYQWSHDGTVIIGATGQTYTILAASGSYVVTVTDTNGCTGASAPYSPSVGVANVNGNNSAISIYPNPVSGIVHIAAAQAVNVSVAGMDGRQLLQLNNATQIDLSALPDGIYLLRITDAKGTLLSIRKLTKARIH